MGGRGGGGGGGSRKYMNYLVPSDFEKEDEEHNQEISFFILLF